MRSYRSAGLDLGAGVTLLLGGNGHGKTTLLESAHRLAVGRSHRVTSDVPLVRHGAPTAVVRGTVATDAGRQRTVEVQLGAGGRSRVDGQAVRRAADATGILRVVLFAPEDLAVVAGDPSERRRFLDDLLAQRRPAHAAVRAEYERVLRQRNQLLRTAPPAGSAARATLDVWSDQLAEHGAALTAARLAAVHALAEPTSALYERLADRPEPVALAYRASAGGEVPADPQAPPPDRAVLARQLHAALEEVADDELRRGLTLVGPHRDDLELELSSLPVRGYASQGQLWSLALALRLATYEILAEVGDRPVVLLDDVFAELDDTRRQRLADACRGWEQVVVTAAAEHDVPLTGRTIEVRLGTSGSELHELDLPRPTRSAAPPPPDLHPPRPTRSAAPPPTDPGAGRDDPSAR